ncbi:MAG: AI-2E family transporter, partial [Gemmatimonadetes bacterium]|nr:AI-2E family transporter [Gemmatimonadota bacterium]
MMVTATVLLTIAGLWLVFRLRGLLVLLLVALFLSFMLEPAVRFLVSKGWRRGLATVVVGLGLFLALVGFLALTLTPLVTQANVLISNLP